MMSAHVFLLSMVALSLPAAAAESDAEAVDAALSAAYKLVVTEKPDRAALDNAVKAFDAAKLKGTERHMRFRRLQRLRRAAVFDKPDAEAAQELADLVKGKVVTAQSFAGKKAFSLETKAEKDKCYFAAIGAIRAGLEVKKSTWLTVGKGPLHQLFKTDELTGFCAVGDGSAKLAVTTEFAGRKNGARVLVVEVDRKAFPLELTTYLQVDVADRCDVEHWTSFWKNPIPGTLAYRDGEPVLLKGTWHSEWIFFRWNSFGTHPAPLSMIDARAKTLKMRDALNPEMTDLCPLWRETEPVAERGAFSKKFYACEDKIRKRNNKARKRLNRKIASARERGFDNLTAQSKLQRIIDRETAQIEKKCKPIADKNHAALKEAIIDLVDDYADNPKVYKRVDWFKQ